MPLNDHRLCDIDHRANEAALVLSFFFLGFHVRGPSRAPTFASAAEPAKAATTATDRGEDDQPNEPQADLCFGFGAFGYQRPFGRPRPARSVHTADPPGFP